MWQCNVCSLFNYSDQLQCIACFHSKPNFLNTNTDCSYDVITIGGGVSGITTASRLSKKGIKCCILEATNRLGGRAKTENWGTNNNPLYIDIGCQWIHFTDKINHPFIHDAKNDYNIDIFKDILTAKDLQHSDSWNERYQPDKEWIIYDISTNNCYDAQIYSEITDNIIEYFEDDVFSESFRDNMKQNQYKYPAKDYNLKEIGMHVYNDYMINNIDNNYDILIQEMKENNISTDGIDKLFMQRCIDWSLAWFEDSVNLFIEETYYHCFDDDRKTWDDIDMNGKFGLFVESIIQKGIDKNMVDIHLNTVCKSIKYNKDTDSMEIVTHIDNEIKNRKYNCRNVVVALSVGCLQKRMIEICDLKQNVWNTIDNGWGQVLSNKIILQFNGQFELNNHIKRLTILCPQKEYSLDDDNKESLYIPGMYQKYSIVRRHIYLDCNVWITFLTPRYAERLIGMDNDKMDKLVFNDIVNVFENVFGVLPKVKKFKMTHYGSDKYFNGSWCYWKKNGNGADDCKKIHNLGNSNLFDVDIVSGYKHNLLFAGDWTQSGYGCCYHAHQSGKRVAAQIIDLYQ